MKYVLISALLTLSYAEGMTKDGDLYLLPLQEQKKGKIYFLKLEEEYHILFSFIRYSPHNVGLTQAKIFVENYLDIIHELNNEKKLNIIDLINTCLYLKTKEHPAAIDDLNLIINLANTIFNKFIDDKLQMYSRL